jgi:hypothetical protein
VNRKQRRRDAAISRRKARALQKFIPDNFATFEPHLQPLIALRLAYRAWHAEIITDKQARSCGVTT